VEYIPLKTSGGFNDIIKVAITIPIVAILVILIDFSLDPFRFIPFSYTSLPIDAPAVWNNALAVDIAAAKTANKNKNTNHCGKTSSITSGTTLSGEPG